MYVCFVCVWVWVWVRVGVRVCTLPKRFNFSVPWAGAKKRVQGGWQVSLKTGRLTAQLLITRAYL